MRRLAFVTLLLAWAAFAQAPAEPKAEAKAHLQNVEQHLSDWNIPAAKRELAELEKLMPGELEPLLYFQGRVALEEGRYQEAVDKLTAAGMGDKPGSYLRLAKDTLEITREHKKVESEHFIFLYPPGKDEVLAPYALETLEGIHAALVKDLGHAPPGKVRVEVLNDADELARTSTLTKDQIRTTGTIALCKYNKLMVTSPKAVVRGYEWLDTLAHEYVHLVVSQKSLNTVPIWLHEGLAKYLESRWRGAAGLAMTPSTLALLGSRVRKNTLVPFEKMHPSMAMLPSAEDAATAFAEVFFAIDLMHKEKGAAGLKEIIERLKDGQEDKQAVGAVMGKSFSAFEAAWLSHLKSQPFPKELIPRSHEKIELKADVKKEEKKKDKEISFGDFTEVEETEARRFAHLGELLRERNRTLAAAEEYGRAHKLVGSRYESVSNKYALALIELRRYDEAQKVLEASLAIHPGSPATNVKLGRLHLRRGQWKQARDSYLDALATNPFDDEIHLALFRAHEALGEQALAERARRAVVILMGAKPENVPAMAKSLEGILIDAPRTDGGH